jgi:hypothetical protein
VCGRLEHCVRLGWESSCYRAGVRNEPTWKEAAESQGQAGNDGLRVQNETEGWKEAKTEGELATMG